MFPGQGSQKVGMGRALARRVSRGARRLRRGRRRRSGYLAVEALLRGARGGADADRERAAGDPRDQRRGAARARGARRPCGRSPSPGTRWASTARWSRRGRCALARRGPAGPPARQVHAGGGAGRAWARWPRSSACRRDDVAAVCREAAGRRGRQRREPERRRPGRDRRAQGRGRSRVRRRQGARREAARSCSRSARRSIAR